MCLSGWFHSKTPLRPIELLRSLSLPLPVYFAIFDILQSLSSTKLNAYRVAIAQVTGDYFLGYGVEAHCSKWAHY